MDGLTNLWSRAAILVGAPIRRLSTAPRRSCEEGDSTLGLGELAQLTVNNDAEVAYDVSLKNRLPHFLKSLEITQIMRIYSRRYKNKFFSSDFPNKIISKLGVFDSSETLFIVTFFFNLEIQMAATTKETFRKTWNAKYTLRSHFDSVRALVFHPTDPVLITASDDHTLKLWNLQKTVPAKKFVFFLIFNRFITIALILSAESRGCESFFKRIRGKNSFDYYWLIIFRTNCFLPFEVSFFFSLFYCLVPDKGLKWIFGHFYNIFSNTIDDQTFVFLVIFILNPNSELNLLLRQSHQFYLLNHADVNNFSSEFEEKNYS